MWFTSWKYTFYNDNCLINDAYTIGPNFKELLTEKGVYIRSQQVVQKLISFSVEQLGVQ